MTAAGLARPNDERNEFNCIPGSPPLTPIGVNSRKRPRTSALSSSTSRSLTAARSFLPPYPPHRKNSGGNDSGNDDDSGSAAAVGLGLTRPQTALQPRKSGTSRSTQLPYIHGGEKGSSHLGDAMVATQRSGGTQVEGRLAWAGDFSSSEEEGKAGGSDGIQLSKSAKLMEEDRKKVASIRSFLLNFLEERDCSIKKRLVRFFVNMNTILVVYGVNLLPMLSSSPHVRVEHARPTYHAMLSVSSGVLYCCTLNTSSGDRLARRYYFNVCTPKYAGTPFFSTERQHSCVCYDFKYGSKHHKPGGYFASNANPERLEGGAIYRHTRNCRCVRSS